MDITSTCQDARTAPKLFAINLFNSFNSHLTDYFRLNFKVLLYVATGLDGMEPKTNESQKYRNPFIGHIHQSSPKPFCFPNPF